MANVSCAPTDPTFWMHHAFIDLLWEEFRNEHQISDPTLEYPSSEYWTDYPVRVAFIPFVLTKQTDGRFRGGVS